MFGQEQAGNSLSLFSKLRALANFFLIINKNKLAKTSFWAFVWEGNRGCARI
jgi:hypothetical protein